MSGLFITFEGGEGGGKSTQIEKLKNVLELQSFDVITTREPGGTPIAERIRDTLLDPENKSITPMAELLLYQAARAQHVEELIIPALEKGSIVLCDRFADSTAAYQGAGRKLSPHALTILHDLATGGLSPDVTFLLDLPPETGLARANQEGTADRIEQESLDFHLRVREAFLNLARNNPDRIHVLDALQPIDDIADHVQAIIKSVLNERGV
jgi:dTMP kinase